MEEGRKNIDKAILRLVSTSAIPDQAALIGLLGREGFPITQGTLSRRLAKLSVRKVNGRYQRVASPSHPIPPYAIAPSTPNLLVLQTQVGLGPALAQRIDRTTLRGVAGTVAGEDTLFIAIHSEASLEDVRDQLEEVLGPPQPAI
jgi:transcriptional regulator of arginine metabolism